MTKAVQQISVAFQGNTGSFSHQAALIYSDALRDGTDEPSMIGCGTFGEVFEAVAENESMRGAIPLENSSMGTIVANYDLFWQHSVQIINEIYLPIHHNLIGLHSAAIDSIKEVYSHPAALEQCRKLFKMHPRMKPIAHWDTSASVLFVKERAESSIAAIASERAANEHGLAILQAHVEDFQHNTTRFGIIAHPTIRVPAHLATHELPWKMTCAVELPHTPGSLGKLLALIGNAGINLTKVESRPIPENPWHYRFFLDFELRAAGDAETVTRVIHESAKAKVLGCYRPLPV